MATIVYIEDEEEIRRNIADELREFDYNVIEADNGVDGLAAIRSSHPDLILCDISMPGMSGLELLSELRDGDARYSDLPFVFLTALADRGDIIDGKKSGADDYLTKPIDLEMLLATIDMRLCQVNRIEENKNRQLVKLYLTLTGEDATQSDASKTPSRGMAITIITDDMFDAGLPVSMLKSQGHNVACLNSGRKFLDILETGTCPDLVLMTFNTLDLSAPLLVKLMKDTYQTPFPALLLIPPNMANKVGDEQLRLFNGYIEFPCTAAEFSMEILKLLPREA